MENLEEAAAPGPSFLDYQVRKVGFVGARKRNELLTGDIVSDENGFIGIVRFTTENFGAWLEFFDGTEGYDKKLKLKLRTLSTSNPAFYEHQKKYYGFIASLARIIRDSLEDDFPAVNMFFNGKDIFVRGATQQAATKRFTAQKVGDQQSYFSVHLTPFFNMTIQAMEVKRSQRKSRFTFNLLRKLFVDIDLKQKQANRIRFRINDSNEYNQEIWERMRKMFKKFNLKFVRT